MLVSFEGFFDSPALVIEAAERRCRPLLVIDIGGEIADLAVGRDLVRQAKPARLSATNRIARIVGTRRVQLHCTVARGRATKGFGGALAAVVAAAHDEAYAMGVDQGDQPCRWIVAVRHQHAVDSELVECLYEHAVHPDACAVHAALQRRSRPRQVQHEQALVGFGCRALEMGRLQYRPISGCHAQPAPARGPGRLIDATNNQILERVQGR